MLNYFGLDEDVEDVADVEDVEEIYDPYDPYDPYNIDHIFRNIEIIASNIKYYTKSLICVIKNIIYVPNKDD